MVLRVLTGRYCMSLGSTGWHNRPVSFNQGVAGSRPVRPTKASEPTHLGSYHKNQGVETLGQPTP